METEFEAALQFAELTLWPDPRELTATQVAEEAGVDVETAKRFWRAMGLPSVPGDECIFGRPDVEALRAVLRLSSGDVDVALRHTRATNSAMSRIADVEASVVRDMLVDGAEPSDVAGTLDFAQAQWLLDYIHRRQLEAALWRQLATSGSGAPLAIGFVDIVGFTALSMELDAAELEDVIASFEALAYDVATTAGGRVVKTIGDEVLFSAPSADEAADIALTIAAMSDADDERPDVRGGLAWGPPVMHNGEPFGTVVNTASRLIQLAHPGTVLATQDFCSLLGDAFQPRPIRPRRLKGLGRVAVWVLRRNQE